VAIRKQFTQPLQVSETPEMRDRIIAIADRENISQGQVIRDLIKAGIAARERKSVAAYPEAVGE